MNKPVRILYIDDYVLDRELVRDALEQEQGGFEVTAVASRQEFETRLAEGDYDLVLSDFNILGFEGLEVIDTVRARDPNLPVVIVTGTGSEQIAAETMKRGAADYVIKSPQHIQRLPHTIQAVMEKKRLRDEQARAHAALRKSESRYKRLLASVTDYIYTVKVENGQAVTSTHGPGCIAVTGYTAKAYQADPHLWYSMIHKDDRQAVTEQAEQMLSGKAAPPLEHRIIHKDGSTRWVRNTPVSRHDQEGRLIAYDGLIADVTERVQAESQRDAMLEALRESEARYRVLNDNLTDMVSRHSPAGDYTYVSAASKALLGYEPEELVGRSSFDFFHPCDVEMLQQALAKALNRQVISSRHRIRRKDGAYTWVESVARAVFDPKTHQVLEFVGVTRDITERMRTEEALRESEAKFRSIVEHSHDGIVLANEQGDVVEWNWGQEQITGLEKAQAIGQPIWDIQFQLLPQAQRTQARYEHGKALTQEYCRTGQFPTSRRLQDVEIQHADGTLRIIQQSPFSFQTEKGRMLGSVTRDITERVRALDALRESKARLSAAIESLPFPFWIMGADGRYVLQNSACKERVGDIIGKLPEEVQKDEQTLAVWQENNRRAFAGEVIKEEVEHTIDGKRQCYYNIVTPVYDGDQMRGILGVDIDITERVLAEEALHQRNRELALLNRLSRTLNSTLDLDHVLIVVLDQVRRLMNVVACSVWLVDAETDELVCRQVTDPQSKIVRGWRLAPGQGLAGWVAQNGSSLNITDIQSDPRHFKGVDQKTGLKLRSILTIPLPGKQKVIGVLQVVDSAVGRFQSTDMALLEPLAVAAAMAVENAQLYEQARQDAETRSVLLREVNHRVKNNLTAIIGLLYTARRRAKVKDPVAYRSAMDGLISRVRGLSTAHDMLSASEWTPLQLSDLAAHVIRATLQMLPRDKHVFVEVSPCPVQVTPNQAHHLALVINEMATNTVKYALQERDEARITVRITLDDDTVCCEFRDDGPGYPKDVLCLERHNVGFDLIQNIVHDNLHGELSLHNDQGAVALLRFKAELDNEENNT